VGSISVVATPFLHIVCCIDYSAASHVALDHARQLRSLGSGRLTLLHAFSRPAAYMMLSEGMTMLPDMTEYEAEAKAWLIAQIQEDWALVEGHAAFRACEWSSDNGADLMIAAAHRGLVARALVGSFAGYVAYHSPCSVLLVRPRR
jgi:nucleotide-binding universal stress UspA family protein